MKFNIFAEKDQRLSYDIDFNFYVDHAAEPFPDLYMADGCVSYDDICKIVKHFAAQDARVATAFLKTRRIPRENKYEGNKGYFDMQHENLLSCHLQGPGQVQNYPEYRIGKVTDAHDRSGYAAVCRLTLLLADLGAERQYIKLQEFYGKCLDEFEYRNKNIEKNILRCAEGLVNRTNDLASDYPKHVKAGLKNLIMPGQSADWLADAQNRFTGEKELMDLYYKTYESLRPAALRNMHLSNGLAVLDKDSMLPPPPCVLVRGI